MLRPPDRKTRAKYFLWTRTIAGKTGLPICGWQVSEGDTDNGWFVNHMTEVSKAPIPLLTVGIRDRRMPSARSRRPVLSLPGYGTPVIECPGNTQATLRNVQGRRIGEAADRP
jgi:hypothetical protein